MKKYKRLTENSYEGTIVYHGTSSKYAQNIVKVGLQPRPNKWYASRADSSEQKREILKSVPKELYVSKDFKVAHDFARDSCYYGGNPIVFSFILKESDEVIAENKHVSSELVINNKIDSSRLKIVYPSDMSIEKLKKKVDASKEKTGLIKQLNKDVFKKYNIKVKSGSKATPRLFIDLRPEYSMTSSILLNDLYSFLLTGKKSGKMYDSDVETLNTIIDIIDKKDLIKLKNLLAEFLN